MLFRSQLYIEYAGTYTSELEKALESKSPTEVENGPFGDSVMIFCQLKKICQSILSLLNHLVIFVKMLLRVHAIFSCSIHSQRLYGSLFTGVLNLRLSQLLPLRTLSVLSLICMKLSAKLGGIGRCLLPWL